MDRLQARSRRQRDHVPETRFGVWFLGTQTWVNYVLEVAIEDLARLIPQRKTSYPTIVDVGCGWGQSFRLLKAHFAPDLMIGIDRDMAMVRASARELQRQGIAAQLMQGNSTRLPLADRSVDMVFCHQTFHHLVDQEGAVREFYRVLKPGGLLLFAESTRAFIHSWMIRLLFRHPMEVQKSSDEYLRLLTAAGFRIAPESVSLPYLWWSRLDLGIMETWFHKAPPANREETLLNLVASRP